MKNRLKDFFTKNIALKILSLVLGFLAWALLSNAQDPIVQRTVEVPVTYLNAYLLDSQDNFILVSGPDSVTINVNVRTSKQNSLNSSLFSCKADLTDRSGGDVKNQRVRINVEQVSGYDVVLDWSYVRNDPNITVEMDEIVERECALELRQAGGLGQGMHLGAPTFTPDTVTVRAPKALFSNVHSVSAVVDLSGAKSNEWYTADAVPVELYDGNSNRIEDSRISITPGSVEVKVFVFGESSVNLKLCYTSSIDSSGNQETTGIEWKEILAKDYVLSDYVIEPTAVNVHGSAASNLNGSFAIPIQTVFDEYRQAIKNGTREPLNGEWSFSVNLSEYLPNGVVLSDPSKNTVTVTVIAEQEETQAVGMTIGETTLEETGETCFAVMEKYYPGSSEETPPFLYDPPMPVELTGRSELYEYELKADEIILSVTGLHKNIGIFSHTRTLLSLDVTDLQPGTYELEFVPAGMSNITINVKESILSVTVTVREAGQGEETED